MTITEQLDEIQQLHDAYAAVRYDDHKPVGLIDQFHEWHGKASTLFSRYLPEKDADFQKFKNIVSGNCYVLSSQFGEIETSYCILVDKIMNSAYVKLEQLISEGETIVQTIKYIKAPSGVLRTFSDYSIGNVSVYETWKNKCIRLLELHFKQDGSVGLFKEAASNFSGKHNNPKYMHDMIGVLRACAEISVVVDESSTDTVSKAPSPVTINLSQTQTQSQSVVVDIFLEAIKDEIPGKNFKELKAIAKEEPDSTKAKSKILEKVKSFGNDVLSNIVANIITNPNIWNNMM